MTRIIANRYVVGSKIGSGGMGDVFRGTDRRTDMPIAIKALRTELATPELIARFVREGETLRQLNHPNIVSLIDAIHEGDQYYLIMELVAGGALDDLLRREVRLPVKRVLNIALDLADALTRAHRLNIIHRDIKPANVLLAEDGMPRLTDFGIARIVGSDITEAGSIMGTIAYIAPEVLGGEPADARSDIWSLGVLLYELLAGDHPFREVTPASMINAILSHPLPDLEAQHPDVPVSLVDLVNRMVMKNPTERIPSMRLVGAELEVLLAASGDSTSGYRPAPAHIDSSGSRFATPSPMASSVVSNNLPVQVSEFVGRENELVELEQLLQDPAARLVTILAPGGMGKTRLSLEVARTFLHQPRGRSLFEHGIYFVDLAPLASAENIVQTVAEAVKYPFQDDGRAARQQLLDFLSQKNVLLLTDNFEHVLAGRDLVQDILGSAPGVKFLATSRERLNLSAETLFVLSGMEFPAWETPADALGYSAVKLFMQSARRVRPDFRLDAGDLAAVARICRMVQGTPLGILLAASWLEALSPAEIAQEIARSLDFLESDLHDLPERQRSLRAVFEYSWNLLTEAEQAAFAQFSIFRGGFTREAVQQITGASLRTLTQMVNKSLLRRNNISGRYEVHELLRQFAQEKFNAAPDRDQVDDAFARYYLGLLEQLTPRLKGGDQLEALNSIETDFENTRAAWNDALRRADAASIQQALEGLYLFLTFRNRFMDGEQLFRAARAVWPAAGENLLAGMLLARYPEHPPLDQFRRALAIAQAHGDAREIAFCQRLVGHWLSHSEFNQADGIPMLEASLSGYRALGDKFYSAQVLDDLGWSHQLMMDRVQQVTLVQESLALRREIGDKIGTANSLRNLGGASNGFFDSTGTAMRYWREAKDIAYAMHDRLGIAWNATLEAANLIYLGEFDRASALLEEASPHAMDINEPVVKGFVYLLQSMIASLRDEDYQRAKELLEAGYPPGTSPDFRSLTAPFAMILVACGLREFDSVRHLLEGVNQAPPPFSQPEFAVTMFTPCRLMMLADAGRFERAAALMGSYFDNQNSFFGFAFPVGWAKQWKLLARLKEHLEQTLGAAAFQAAWARGLQIDLAEQFQEIQAFVRPGQD
jgi:serine/threonine protein kinase